MCDLEILNIVLFLLKRITIMKTLMDSINEKIDAFQTNATLHVEKANKAAGTRARKASLEISKLMKEFRQKSMELQNKI